MHVNSTKTFVARIKEEETILAIGHWDTIVYVYWHLNSVMTFHLQTVHILYHLQSDTRVQKGNRSKLFYLSPSLASIRFVQLIQFCSLAFLQRNRLKKQMQIFLNPMNKNDACIFYPYLCWEFVISTLVFWS